MTIIEMRDKRTKLLATMDGFLDTHRDSKGVLSAEDDATYTGMEKELAAITNEIKRMERREAIDAELSKPVSTPITGKPMNGTGTSAKVKTGRAADEYTENFWNVMRSKAPMPQVVNALQVGDDAEGGYLVPDEYEKHLVEALEEENIFRKLAHTVQTDSGERKIPVVASKGTANWIDEEGPYEDIFEATASYGHFGRRPYTEIVRFVGDKGKEFAKEVEFFSWEKLDEVDRLKSEFGL